jgi:hypothetical protein
MLRRGEFIVWKHGTVARDRCDPSRLRFLVAFDAPLTVEYGR